MDQAAPGEKLQGLVTGSYWVGILVNGNVEGDMAKAPSVSATLNSLHHSDALLTSQLKFTLR